MNDSIGFGVTRFTYSREILENCYCALDSNQWNVTKAFGIVWTDPDSFGKHERNIAEYVLMMLERMCALKTIFGRNMDGIISNWHVDNKTFDKVHLNDR